MPCLELEEHVPEKTTAPAETFATEQVIAPMVAAARAEARWRPAGPAQRRMHPASEPQASEPPAAASLKHSPPS